MLTPLDLRIIERHLDTDLSLDATAADLRRHMPYLKTYDFPGDYVDGYHQWLSRCPVHPDGMIDIEVEGWLLRTEALKLYELAYFSGDIFELGTYKGLSTTIMAYAVFNSGRQRPIITCDTDPVNVAEARLSFKARQVPDRELHHFFHLEGTGFARSLGQSHRRFSLVYVDHVRGYEAVRDTCEALPAITEPGAFVLFRDYNHPSNRDARDSYGVYKGVLDGLSRTLFDFYGVFGSLGLFRKAA